MNFKPIFDNENCRLWAVLYYEDDKIDIFEKIFDDWSNTEYLNNFFVQNENLLKTKFWGWMSVSQAIDQVRDEAYDFEYELLSVVNDPKKDIKDVFEHLHEGVYALKRGNEQLRKVRTNPELYNKPILRIYAVELDDGCLIVTGGAIKLTEQMEGEQMERELNKLKSLQRYLQEEKIVSKEGLL